FGRIARLAITAAPGGRVTCEIVPLGLPSSTANAAPVWIGDAGQVLIQRIDMKTGAITWDWIAHPGDAPVELANPAPPGPSRPVPVVARNGSAVAWVAPIA